MQGEGLHTLLSRADSGDPREVDAVYGELARLVRMLVRSGMGPKLRDHRESGDVCQSIVRSFVEDQQARAIRFGSEGELVNYLKTVVRSKLAMLARSDGAIKRGGEVVTQAMGVGGSVDGVLADGGAGPEAVDAREALDEVRAKLSDEDQEIARLRLAGVEWAQIAARLGREAGALRKRWSRLAAQLADEDA